jgi:hypothetical protein
MMDALSLYSKNGESRHQLSVDLREMRVLTSQILRDSSYALSFGRQDIVLVKNVYYNALVETPLVGWMDRCFDDSRLYGVCHMNDRLNQLGWGHDV